MGRDQLIRRPGVARAVLVLGAIVHFALCIPLYGRRGYPEIDPFWLAMAWLWVPAIPISAVFDKWSHSRAIELGVYAVATAFTVSWGWVYFVPNSKGPVDALLDAIFGGIAVTQLFHVFLVEALSRFALRHVRTFTPKTGCESCGYDLRGLREARCPECGRPFPKSLIGRPDQARPMRLQRRWSILLVLALLALSVLFVPAYRQYRFASLARQGAAQAQKEWTAGQATWFVTQAEIAAMSQAEYKRFSEMRHEVDPASGLFIEEVRGDWENQAWRTSYRAVIEQELKKAGRSPPKFK